MGKLTQKKEYDLIISLGGSCATSLQLRRRNLQFQTFPFDWLFHINENQITSLSKGFKNNFKDWFSYDKLKELTKDEKGDSHNYQYKDLETGFRYIHDFEKPKYYYTEYNKIKEKYVKRQERLIKYIEKSNNILFIVEGDYEINERLLIEFITTLHNKFSSKRFNLICLRFNSNKKNIKNLKNILIYEIDRCRTKDDFFNTVKEWEFLDNIKLSFKGKYLQKQFTIKGIFLTLIKLKKKIQLKTRKLRYTVMFKRNH